MTILLGYSSFTYSDDQVYLKHVVLKGQSLGTILYSYNIGPLWGKGRKVEQFALLNKVKVEDAGNLVRAGTVLIVPKSWLNTAPMPPVRLPAQVNELDSSSDTTSQTIEAEAIRPNSKSEALQQAPTETSSDSSPSPVPSERRTNAIEAKQEFSLWIGSGMNLLQYDQSFAGGTEVNFSSITGPSLYVGIKTRLNNYLGANAFFKDSPGEALSSDQVQVRNGKYRWQTLSFEGVWYSNSQSSLMEGFLLFGFQHHRVPFVDVISSTAVDVSPKIYNLASVGLGAHFFGESKVRAEVFLRYQFLLSSQSSNTLSYTAESIYSFDGSIGAYRAFDTGLRVGLFWYGQAQQFNYNTRFSNGVSGNGDQHLFFSNIELRLGYEL